MPHRAVLRETAETSKMRVVYDCSARGAKEAPSLNDCPALQNKIYDSIQWPSQEHAPSISTGSHQRGGA